MDEEINEGEKKKALSDELKWELVEYIQKCRHKRNVKKGLTRSAAQVWQLPKNEHI